jgi:hypothetical protein
LLTKKAFMKKIAIIFWALSLRPVWASQFEPQMLEFCALALMMGAVPILFGQNRGLERLAWLNLKSKQAHCLMALAFENAGTPNKACPESHKPARDAESYYQLGEKYYHGLGVKRDDEVAVFYYTKAAKKWASTSPIFVGLFLLLRHQRATKSHRSTEMVDASCRPAPCPSAIFVGFYVSIWLGCATKHG